MKKSKIIIGLMVLAILASNTACSSKNNDELMESSTVMSETTAATETTTETTLTVTPEVTTEETQEETQEPTESRSELEKRISYMRELHSVQIKYTTYYLKIDQEVHLRDLQAADGILSEDLGTTTLVAGTVLTPLLSSGEASMDLSVDTIFVLVDGRCVTFDITTEEDGALRVNGYPTEEIFGHFTGTDDGIYEILTAGAFLYEDQDGNRMIIDSYDYCSSDYATFVYTYDPEKFIAVQEFGGVFNIVDGKMILERNSTVLGNLDTMIYPVTIADGQFMVAERSTEIYWQSSWNMDPDSSAYPNFYSCTLQDITAERFVLVRIRRLMTGEWAKKNSIDS